MLKVDSTNYILRSKNFSLKEKISQLRIHLKIKVGTFTSLN